MFGFLFCVIKLKKIATFKHECPLEKSISSQMTFCYNPMWFSSWSNCFQISKAKLLSIWWVGLCILYSLSLCFTVALEDLTRHLWLLTWQQSTLKALAPSIFYRIWLLFELLFPFVYVALVDEIGEQELKDCFRKTLPLQHEPTRLQSDQHAQICSTNFAPPMKMSHSQWHFSTFMRPTEPCCFLLELMPR